MSDNRCEARFNGFQCAKLAGHSDEHRSLNSRWPNADSDLGTRQPEPPTVPLSDHQRLQAEAAEMRRALEAAQKGLKDYLVACGRVIPDSWFDHLLEIGLLTQDHPLNYVVERKDGPLSSSAGSALLAEMEGMRKERDEVRAVLRKTLGHNEQDGLSPASEIEAMDEHIRENEAESASLRARLETVERERDEALKTVQSNRVLRDSEVRRAVEEAVAKEREACAKLADSIAMSESRHTANLADDVAAAIRARGGA